MPSWMRLTLFVFAMLAVGAPAALAAQPTAAQPAPGTEQPGTEQPGAQRPGAEQFGAPIEVAPNAGSVQFVEIDSRPVRPSGFWTSTRPAQGGAYRYRLLGIGVVVMFMTLGFMLWVIRRKGRPVEQVE